MSSKGKSGSVGGFLRPLMSVIVLTAFILAITFIVKGVAQLRVEDIAKETKPLMAKLNINLDTSKVGQVAGSMVSRFTNADLGGGGSSERINTSVTSTTSEPTGTPAVQDTPQSMLFKIALLADSHSDYENLTKALDITKSMSIGTVMFLGDFTQLGLLDDLTHAKEIMDKSGLKYYALAGDHDLWKSVGFDNFLQVFGKNNQSILIHGIKFVLLDNSANYTEITPETMAWFKEEVSNADFVILSQPLYYPRLDRYMGHIDGEDVSKVLAQRDMLLEIIRNTNVKAVISADLHTSDSIDDPVKSELKHIQVGAITRERNLQSPRFSVFKYYENGSYDVQDVVLE